MKAIKLSVSLLSLVLVASTYGNPAPSESEVLKDIEINYAMIQASRFCNNKQSRTDAEYAVCVEAITTTILQEAEQKQKPDGFSDYHNHSAYRY